MKTCILYNHTRLWVSQIHATLERDFGYTVLRLPNNMSFYPVEPLSEKTFQVNYERIREQTLAEIREKDVRFIFNVNTYGWLHNPASGRLLFDELDIPVINFWWDDPRYAMHPIYRVLPPKQIWGFFSNPKMLHFVWDLEVARAARRLGAAFAFHCPTAVDPGFYPEPAEEDNDEQGSDCMICAAYKWVSEHVDCGRLSAELAGFAGQLSALRVQNPGVSPVEMLKANNLNWEKVESECMKCDPSGEALVRFLYLADKACTNALRDQIIIFLKKQLSDRFQIYGEGWERAGIESALPVWDPQQLAGLYRSARTCLNVQGGNSPSGLPMRIYEAAVCGGLVLTQNNPEISTLFTPGKECAVFDTPQQALELVEFYCSHEDERRAMAEAGRKRALVEHTWKNRLDFIFCQFSEKI